MAQTSTLTEVEWAYFVDNDLHKISTCKTERTSERLFSRKKRFPPFHWPFSYDAIRNKHNTRRPSAAETGREIDAKDVPEVDQCYVAHHSESFHAAFCLQ